MRDWGSTLTSPHVEDAIARHRRRRAGRRCVNDGQMGAADHSRACADPEAYDPILMWRLACIAACQS